MARKVEELIGEYDYTERYYPASDGQIKILPGRLIDGTQVVGYCDEAQLQSGLTYLFRGYWKDDEKYGKQFLFHSVGLAQPVGERGTVAYLQRGPGIGRKRAVRLWELYGQDALEAVRDRPQEIAAALAGLTEEQATEAAAWFKVHKDREIVTRDLEEIGLTKRQQEQAIEKWGAGAAQFIRDNAFILMGLRGISFLKADKLYLELGGDPQGVERLAWCAWNALHRERQGNTWTTPGICTQAILQSVSVLEVHPGVGISYGVESKIIARRVDSSGRIWLAENSKAKAEMRLANAVHRAIAEGI